VDPVGNERESRESRVLARQSPSLPGGAAKQQTLTGDPTEIDNDGELEDRIERNQAKAENDRGDESEVAAGQLKLEFFDAGQTRLDAWTDVLGARDRGAA
jgi:hypothetical protein